jgi:hypothetical protein
MCFVAVEEVVMCHNTETVAQRFVVNPCSSAGTHVPCIDVHPPRPVGAVYPPHYEDAEVVDCVTGAAIAKTIRISGPGFAATPGWYDVWVGGTCFEKAIVVIQVDINGDYNRNGNPADDVHEGDAVTFEGPKGCVILANQDDDNGDKTPDAAKNPPGDPLPGRYTINMVDDVLDIHEVHVCKLGIPASSIPPRWVLEFAVVDPSSGAASLAATIYPDRNPGTEGNSTLTFSGAGLASRFGGTGVTVIGSDQIRVLVAPFFVLSNAAVATRVYTGSAAIAGCWDVFHGNVAAALAGVVPVESIARMQFVQDHGEIGYTARLMPALGGLVDRRTVILGLFPVTFTRRVDRDTGFFWVGGGDGGSIEASPPISGYPYGRIVVGDRLAAGTKAFLKAQRVQTDMGNLIELPVDWLAAGHADEVFTIVPTTGGFKVLAADLDLAISILRGHPADLTSGGHRAWAEIVAEYDANPARVAVINGKLALVRSALSTGLAIAESALIRIPVAFSVHTPSKYYLPNMVNMLVVNTAGGTRRLLMPRPFFQPFVADLETKLATIGYRAPEWKWVDTTTPHASGPHICGGEVHCATNARREAP